MYVCMYVCMYIYIYIYIHAIYIHTYIHACIHTDISSMCVSVYIRLSVSAGKIAPREVQTTSPHEDQAWRWTQEQCVRACVRACVCVCVCVCVCMYFCMWVCGWVHTHTHTHIHTYIYPHTGRVYVSLWEHEAMYVCIFVCVSVLYKCACILCGHTHGNRGVAAGSPMFPLRDTCSKRGDLETFSSFSRHCL